MFVSTKNKEQLSENAQWTKVSELRPGMEIAVYDPEVSDGAVWEEIVSIKSVGREQVYDIEVEGTHNFVAGHLLEKKTGKKLAEKEEQAVLAENINSSGSLRLPEALRFGGIIAHNTYLSGNVGIGVTTPAYKLDVLKTSTGGATAYIANLFHDGNDADYHGLRVQAGADDASGTTYYLDAYDGDGTSIGYLANVSDTFGVTTVSDIRTKVNVVNTTLNGLEIINNLRVVDFNRSQNPDGPLHYGFVAQEVQAVFPYMVNEGPDGMLGIQKDLLIPILTKAIQEQQSKLSVIDDNMQLVQNELGVSAGDTTSRLTSLELGIGNQESGILSLESRTQNQESRIKD